MPSGRDRLGQGRPWMAGLAALLLGCLLAGPGAAAEKVTLRLQWTHQAQFAGFYLAQDQGLYQRAGLEVKILPGGPGVNPLSELNQGHCDFCTAWLVEAVCERGQGTPLVHLAQMVRRSSLVLVAFADTGIQKPFDLDGKRVGLWQGAFAVAPRALFRRMGIKVQEVDQNVSMAAFLNRAVDAATAMLYNEYHQLFQAGVDQDELKVFSLAELGMNFPEDGIYAHQKTWRERPDVCRRFVEATLEGWRRVLAHPEQALEAVMRRVDGSRLASNRSHQKWMIQTMRKLVAPGSDLESLGSLSMGDLAVMQRMLVEQGFLTQPVDPDQFLASAWRKP